MRSDLLVMAVMAVTAVGAPVAWFSGLVPISLSMYYWLTAPIVAACLFLLINRHELLHGGNEFVKGEGRNEVWRIFNGYLKCRGCGHEVHD